MTIYKKLSHVAVLQQSASAEDKHSSCSNSNLTLWRQQSGILGV